MPKISVDEISHLLTPYLGQEAPRVLCEKVQRYAALLEVWNRKLNLTAVREPERIIERHFGESFFMARLLPEFQTLLDFGSGAGFPGLPISLLRPAADVTLAEVNTRKAIFLREAAWMTGSQARVAVTRAEEISERSFDVVVLRAVDNMPAALEAATLLLSNVGTLAFFVGESGAVRLPDAEWSSMATYDVPLSTGRIAIASLQGPVPDLPAAFDLRENMDSIESF